MAKSKHKAKAPSKGGGRPAVVKAKIAKPARPSFSSGKAAKKRAHENAKRKPGKRAAPDAEEFETVPATEVAPDANDVQLQSGSDSEDGGTDAPEVIAEKYAKAMKLVLQAEELLEEEGGDDDEEGTDMEQKLREAKTLLKQSLKVIETVEACALLAEAYLEEAAVEKAVLCLNRCIELDPDSPDAYSKLAEVMAAAGELPQAVRYERECVRLLEAACHAAAEGDGEDETAEGRKEVLALHLLTLAELLAEAEDGHAALAAAQRAAEVAPASAQAALLHGELLLRQAAPDGPGPDGPPPGVEKAAGELRRGVELCEQAGEEVPVSALRSLGEASLVLGDLDAAVARLRPAADRAAAALHAARRRRAKAGKRKGRGKADEKEEEDEEEEGGLRAALAESLFMLGDAHRQREELDEAEAAWRRLAEQVPEGRERVHNSLSLLYLVQGRHGEAEAEIRAAIGLAPEVAALHLTLGDVLLAAGRPAEAKRAFLAALELDPDAAAGEALERAKRCDAPAAPPRGRGRAPK